MVRARSVPGCPRSGRPRRHEAIFFQASYAHNDRCPDGRFRLVPDPDRLASLRSDHDAARRAGIVGAEAPGFDALMDEVRNIQTELNHRSRESTDT